ncbi:MAG: hypothetical protein AB7D36_05490 [Oscillospiraceae bacterium]
MGSEKSDPIFIYAPVVNRAFLCIPTVEEYFAGSGGKERNMKNPMIFYLEEYFKAAQPEPGHYIVTLTNDAEIHIYTDAVYPDTGTVWEWKVDGQYFDHEEWALGYLKTIMTEKLTGIRIIYRNRREAPDICAWGKRCRSPGECDRALCSDCPVADEFFAARDGVKIIYAIK